MENPQFNKLREHIGHSLECVIYGQENIAIECIDCNQVLISENIEEEE